MGEGLRVLRAPPPAGWWSLTQILFAHLIAEVCDALALIVIALGFSTRALAPVNPLVAGAAQHR